MTIIACPHGCGGVCDTARDSWCPSCRRGLNETEVVVSAAQTIQGPTERKESWCWSWFGPADHRMRCRLPQGHASDHDCKEDRQPGEISVSTTGQLVCDEYVHYSSQEKT